MTLFDIYKTYCKIGFITFGGGYAMIGVMERELVTQRHWLDKEEFLDMVALSQSLPGALAVNMAAMAGKRMKPRFGAAFAYAGVVTPSLLVIYLIARFFEPYMDLPLVRAAFQGLSPAVIGLMAAAVIQLGRGVHPNAFNLTLLLFGCTAVALLGWHPLVTILAAGAAGYLMKGRAVS